MTKQQQAKWLRCLAKAQKLNGHTGSCWTTGGPEICDKCFNLAIELDEGV